MKRGRPSLRTRKGFALVYMAAVLTTLLLGSGLALDLGRAYVVKAQLTKAVDGAALAAARNVNNGNPQSVATQIFKANFPPGYMGTTGSDPTAAAGFYSSSVDTVNGVNIVNVTASTTLPTTLMKLANFSQVTITSTSQATRR